jgi:hypothetical protein
MAVYETTGKQLSFTLNLASNAAAVECRDRYSRNCSPDNRQNTCVYLSPYEPGKWHEILERHDKLNNPKL